MTGNIFFNTNGQNFRIRGIETSLIGRVAAGLTLQGCDCLESECADEFARS